MPQPEIVNGKWQWQPSEPDLEQILTLLHHSQSQDNEIQRNVQAELDSLNKQPEFFCYLSYIFNELKNEQVNRRALSGLLLKNSVRLQWQNIPINIKQFLKQHCFLAIAEESPLLRATTGIIITTIFCHEGCAGWPELLPTLCQMLEADDRLKVLGALSALQKICEDSSDRLIVEEVSVLVSKVLPFFRSETTELRTLAVNTINSILLVQNEAFVPIIDPFLENLFQLAHDPVEEIQKELCRSLTLLLECYVEKIEPQLENIAHFMLEKTQHDNLEIAQEACEFWLGLAENSEICKRVVAPILPKLTEVLLKCMRYSNYDLTVLRSDLGDDSNVPDRVENIKPRFHKTRNQMGENDQKEAESDGEENDYDTFIEWSLRKCAAASLDMLSGIFSDSFLESLLPLVKTCLQNSNWIIRESGILALGAVSEGCATGMTPHLPELIPYLINQLSDGHALVRSITCWTLSRYCHFVVFQPQNEIFKVLLTQLLERILDRNKRVQEAACSAFATFEEEAASELIPYLPSILVTLVEAFNRYQARNLLILYDAIGTLADSVRSKLGEPPFSELLMKPLLLKCQQICDDDRELFPLLECISSVVNALGTAFLTYAEPVFQRCIRLINNTLNQVASEQANQPDNSNSSSNAHIETDKDFLVVALDLISELVEGVRGEMLPIIKQGNLVQLTYICAQDSSKEVRQSSFALLGDLVKTCFEFISSDIESFMPILISNLDAENVSVCNNAIWALGEISLKTGDSIRQYVPLIVVPLIDVMNREKVTRTLLENTAITLGRLGLCFAAMVAPYLSNFIRPWCVALRNIHDNDEKESAFRGICYMINENPQGIVHYFVFFCDALASWSNPPYELRVMFRSILMGFRNQVGTEIWSHFVAQFPDQLRIRLQTLYELQ